MRKLIFLFVLFPAFIFGQSGNYDNIHFSGLVPSVTTNKAYANPAHHFYWNGMRLDSIYSTEVDPLSFHKADSNSVKNPITLNYYNSHTPAAQIQSDWNQTNNVYLDYIKNKPSIPAAQVNSDWNAVTGLAEILNKPSLQTIINGTGFVKASGTTLSYDNSTYLTSNGLPNVVNFLQVKVADSGKTSTGNYVTNKNLLDKGYITTWSETDPVFALDSAKILHWSDSINKIATKKNLIDGLSLKANISDSLKRVYDSLTNIYTQGQVDNLLAGKQNILNPISDGYVPYQSATTHAFVNSHIYDDGTNIGIGTTTPQKTLTVQSATVASYFQGGNGGYSALTFSGDNGATMASLTTLGGVIYLGSQNSGGTGSNGEVVIKSGNVGIGTTAPYYKGDIAGDFRIQGTYKHYFGGTTGAGTDYLYAPSSGTLSTASNLTLTGANTYISVPGSATNSSAIFGALELQSYSLSDNYINNNLYYYGGWKYRADNPAVSGMLLFTEGSFYFRNAPANSGGAGAVANLTTRVIFDASGNGTFGGTVTGTQLISNIATGTSPLAVTSTTVNANLNAEYLQGHPWADVPAGVDTTTAGTGLVNKTRMSHTTSYPTLNQNTTGTAAGLAAAYIDWTSGSGGTHILNKPTIPVLSESITYVQLESKIKHKQLIIGQKYYLSNFATTNFYLNGTTTLSSYSTASTEPLILTATSDSSIDKVASSSKYPNDIIWYDWNKMNWCNDIGFSGTTGGGFDTTNMVTGWKGVIYFRHDLIQDVSLWYDFRGVKFRRWKVTVKPAGFTTDYISPNDSSAALTLYQDVYTFNVYRTVSTTHIGRNHSFYPDPATATTLNNIVFVDLDMGETPTDGNGYYTMSDNNIGDYSYNSTISGVQFMQNSFGPAFADNIITDGCIGNIVGGEFAGNKVYESFVDNSVGKMFGGNTIKAVFLQNVIANQVSLNIFNGMVWKCVFGAGVNTNIYPAITGNVIMPLIYTTTVGATRQPMFIDNIGLIGVTGVKKYVALLTQTGTSAPTATVLENSIGTIVWSYAGVGWYKATLTGAFTSAKTVIFISAGFPSGDGYSTMQEQQINANEIDVYTRFSYPSDAYANDILYGTSISITVYP